MHASNEGESRQLRRHAGALIYAAPEQETADKHIVNKALQPKGEDMVGHVNIYLQPEREEETYTFLSMHNNIC